MTGTELRDLFLSSEFKQGLEGMSSYLASIMQERPIVYLLAKCLWERGYKFTLERERCDLSLNGKKIEFKYNYDKCQEDLKDELEEFGDNLTGMWELVQAQKKSKSWSVMARIYADVCVKKPHIFVWIIYSRDLSKVAADDLERICLTHDQCKYNATLPYTSDEEHLAEVDQFLGKLRTIRPFSLLKQAIQTNGDFPSTYHFRICDFATAGGTP